MIENRKSYRLPLKTKLIFSDGLDVNVGNIFNISMGGVFVTLTSNPQITRDKDYRLVFSLGKEIEPVSILGEPKRIVALSLNPEVIPGVGFAFKMSAIEELKKIEDYVVGVRRNFEIATAVLSSGDPDWSTLGPVLNRLGIPAFSDLNELKFYCERIMKTIEMVDQNNHSKSTS